MNEISGSKKRPDSSQIFERRFNILLFAVRATQAFTVKDVFEAVIDAPRQTVLNCLSDLVDLNLLERKSIYTYEATAFAKELMGAGDA